VLVSRLRRREREAATLLAISLSLSSTARAGEGATPPAVEAPRAGEQGELAERAKQLYALGAEAFAAQRNAEAIRYFRRAAELVPSAKLTYNIGLAYEEMGDAGRALTEYRAYLKQEPEAVLSDEVRGRISGLEHRLAESGVQQLGVSSEPAGATVFIGGRPVGVTPWAGELAPGPHDVELTLAGHAPAALSVTLPADRSAEVRLPLVALSAPAEREPSGLANVSPLAWTFLGVGAGALVGGVVFELSRQSSSTAAERARTPLEAAEASGAADAKQMASLLLLGFGSAFTIGGTVLLVLDVTADDGADDRDAQPPRTSAASRAQLALPCSPGFCGIMAQGNF
jgi:tetratricopeptide (TPR) repeat protein